MSADRPYTPGEPAGCPGGAAGVPNAPTPTVPEYASRVADYAPTAHPDAEGALIVSVEPGSPADDAGILPGMRVTQVAGKPLTDMIVWQWEADGEEADIVVYDGRDGTYNPVTLERFLV